MKTTLLSSILLFTFLAKAQGPQQLVDVPYDYWPGATVKGWLYLPADYATSTKKYPVVFFYHGVGEAGTNPYTLLNQGIPNLIANGMRPDNITNPKDGQKYSFIVVSVQHWSWSPNPTWLPYELAWLKQNYRIDTNRVYVTGLSAGGQTSYSATIVNPNVSRLVAAAAPMSPAQVWPYDPALIGQNKIKTWFFSGNVDGGYTVNATNYSNDCNTLYPSSSKLNIYSGGHCCWNNYYNTTWHDASTGQSVWEWMLTNEKQIETSLPVKFISLDLNKETSGIRVTWKVAEEENVSVYEVEKSNDARTFMKAGEVVANTQSAYSFIDKQSPANFYRIKSVDVDGKYKYSSIVRYNGGKSSVVLKVFPTLVQNELTIQHPAAASASKIEISAADGKTIKSIIPEPGTQQTILNLSSFKPGLYFVRYRDANDLVETTKIVKR
jgi:dienelactone hydrolase